MKLKKKISKFKKIDTQKIKINNMIIIKMKIINNKIKILIMMKFKMIITIRNKIN